MAGGATCSCAIHGSQPIQIQLLNLNQAVEVQKPPENELTQLCLITNFFGGGGRFGKTGGKGGKRGKRFGKKGGDDDKGGSSGGKSKSGSVDSKIKEDEILFCEQLELK